MAVVEALILCDHAQVRDGLLFVNSGGITRVTAQRFPVQVRLHLAVMLWVPPLEIDKVHELRVSIKHPDSVLRVAEIVTAFKVNAETMPGEGLHVPHALDLVSIPFPAVGQYDIQAHIDGAVGPDVSFWISQSEPTDEDKS